MVDAAPFAQFMTFVMQSLVISILVFKSVPQLVN